MDLIRVPILGVEVNPLTMDNTLVQFEEWINEKKKAYVCVIPAHSIMECIHNPALLPIFNNADLGTPDGMSIVWLLKLKGYKACDRVYGPDLLDAACHFGVNKHWKHYFMGGETGTAQNLAEKLQSNIKGLMVAGSFSPSFGTPDKQENDETIERLNQSGADILWVGMSSPLQETWMNNNRNKINIPVMVGVGAAFDFLSGSKKQAPHWIQVSGFEWLFRLINEPKRLWPRYKHYPRFVWLALRELIFHKSPGN